MTDSPQQQETEPRPPVAERVRTAAGWHGRIAGANGETVWTTEVYPRKREATAALKLLGRVESFAVALDVDER